MGQAKTRGTRDERIEDAIRRDASAPNVELPDQLNCQKCGHLMPVKWKSVSKQHSAYRGKSTCSVCRSHAVHMIGDEKFLRAFSTGTESLGADQVDIFGKDTGGEVVHVYSSDTSPDTTH
jgi:hypothetical protein